MHLSVRIDITEKLAYWPCRLSIVEFSQTSYAQPRGGSKYKGHLRLN